MALIKCPECGKEVSDQSENCIHCGCPLKTQKVAEGKKCPKCGKEINGHSKYCLHCGFQLQEEKAAEGKNMQNANGQNGTQGGQAVWATGRKAAGILFLIYFGYIAFAYIFLRDLMLDTLNESLASQGMYVVEESWEKLRMVVIFTSLGGVALSAWSLYLCKFNDYKKSYCIGAAFCLLFVVQFVSSGSISIHIVALLAAGVFQIAVGSVQRKYN